MIDKILTLLTTDQQFMLVFLILVFGILIFFYFHRLLTLYSERVDTVMKWNQGFKKPMYFRYSWLKGVSIGVQDLKTEEERWGTRPCPGKKEEEETQNPGKSSEEKA